LILLDTHVVIWLAQDYQRISATAQAKIENARQIDSGLAISDVTFLEIAQLANRQRINLTPNAETVLTEIERRFVVLPITANITLQAFELPATYPKDPADRIIGATALIEDIPLLTADREIRKSRVVQTIW
jgi:PIN domain nuclease of toxin-antitoxin system